MRDYPSISILDVREEAIRRAKEDDISAPHSHVVSSQETTSSEQPSPPSLASTMAEIMKILQGQQKAIADLASNISKITGYWEAETPNPATASSFWKWHHN